MALSDKPTPYVYLVFDPDTGMHYGQFTTDARRAVDFARNVGGICVRLYAERAVDVTGPPKIRIEWKHG